MNDRFINFTFDVIKLYKLIQKIKLIEMREYDLKAIHVMCIYHLYAYGKLSAGELIKLTLEDKAAISRALKTLSEKKFVVFNRKGYNSPIELSERGAEVARAIDEKAQRAVDAAGGTLSDKQRVTLYDCLGVISNRLEEYYKLINGNEGE